jgi:hypothetical protein
MPKYLVEASYTAEGAKALWRGVDQRVWNRALKALKTIGNGSTGFCLFLKGPRFAAFCFSIGRDVTL